MLRRVILSHPVPVTIVALAPRTNLALLLRIHPEVDTENLTVQSPNFGKDWFSADVVDDAQHHSQCIVPLAASPRWCSRACSSNGPRPRSPRG